MGWEGNGDWEAKVGGVVREVGWDGDEEESIFVCKVLRKQDELI